MNAEAPKLVEELTLLRNLWGEGFDEDVAQPLARIVRTLREQYKAHIDVHGRQISEMEERIYHLEAELEAKDEMPEELAEELRDCSRGIRDISEVLAEWSEVPV